MKISKCIERRNEFTQRLIALILLQTNQSKILWIAVNIQRSIQSSIGLLTATAVITTVDKITSLLEY
jgi:hypothetical protein